MVPRRALLAAVVLVSLAACSGGSDQGPESAEPSAPSAVASIDAALPPAALPPGALPPGALVELVPTVAELPAGFTAFEGGAGPVDLAALAELSPDPEAATAELERERFRDGYSAQYASESGGDFASVLVTRFGDANGARAHFAREKRESSVGTEAVTISPIGDESFAFKEKLTEGDISEIASVFFRVGDLVWLVETSGQSNGDIVLAQSIAAKLAKRIS